MDDAISPEAIASEKGWAGTRGPHEVLLCFELTHLDEPKLCRLGKPVLLGLGSGPDDYHPEREAVVLVHGMQGAPADLQGVVNRLRGNGRCQLYIVAYNSYHERASINGQALADELAGLRTYGPTALTIVAHSMGGIVAMQAIAHLVAGAQPSSQQWTRIRLVGIDNPWHGYPGPSDRGAQGVLMELARPFMPAGLEDMRAESTMFQGDREGPTAADRAGLLNLQLPENVELHLAFSQSATEVYDYTRDRLVALPPALLDYFTREVRIDGKDPMVWNFWKALLAAHAYGRFQGELRAAAEAGTLTLDGVQQALRRHYPRFPGDHMGVLGEPSFLDWMEACLTTDAAA